MRKFLIALVSIIIITSLMFLPGCKNGNPTPSNNYSALKIYQISGSGGTAQMSVTNQSGIVFADGLLQLGSNYILFIGGDTPNIEAYVQQADANGNLETDSNGNPVIVNTPVTITKDFSEDGYADCISFNSMQQQSNGITMTEVIPTIPGKCNLVAVGGGYTASVEVLVYDGITTGIPLGSGVAINNTGHTMYVDQASSAIFCDNATGNIILTGKSYKATTADQTNWRSQLVNIKSINADFINSGTVNNILNVGDVRVAQVAGGYIKICYIQGAGIIWEFSSTNNFR